MSYKILLLAKYKIWQGSKKLLTNHGTRRVEKRRVAYAGAASCREEKGQFFFGETKSRLQKKSCRDDWEGSVV
jgi:hypothetical protein